MTCRGHVKNGVVVLNGATILPEGMEVEVTAPHNGLGRREGALEMLRHWREEDATTDAAEIERRRRSWEAFKAGLNEHHSSGRKVYP